MELERVTTTLPLQAMGTDLEAQWRTVLEEHFGPSTNTVAEMVRALEEESTRAGPLPESSVLVLSSGSATGKTHFGRYLRAQGWVPIARTKDRGIRPDETEGVDGHYVDHQTFDRLLDDNCLVGVTGSYGDRRGYDLPAVLSTLRRHPRCVSSDGYSFVRLAAKHPELYHYTISSVYLLPPDLPTLMHRIVNRALERFDPSAGKSIEAHLAEQKIGPRLAEGPNYLREALKHACANGGRPLVDRFVVYDDPDRVARVLGLT
jgi:guanylate kinase